jgi:hypothetical protein
MYGCAHRLERFLELLAPGLPARLAAIRSLIMLLPRTSISVPVPGRAQATVSSSFKQTFECHGTAPRRLGLGVAGLDREPNPEFFENGPESNISFNIIMDQPLLLKDRSALLGVMDFLDARSLFAFTASGRALWEWRRHGDLFRQLLYRSLPACIEPISFRKTYVLRLKHAEGRYKG